MSLPVNGRIVTRFGLAGLRNAKTAGLGKVDADSAQGSEGGWGLEQAPTHSKCGLEALRALQSHSPVLQCSGGRKVHRQAFRPPLGQVSRCRVLEDLQTWSSSGDIKLLPKPSHAPDNLLLSHPEIASSTGSTKLQSPSSDAVRR